MRKAFFWLPAAFVALGACGGIPSSAEGWYTPSGGFRHETSEGSVYYYDEDGYLDSAYIEVDEYGNVTGTVEMDIDSPAYPAYMALVKALKAETIAQQNKERIEEIGNNLDSVFSSDGVKLEMEREGPGGDKYTVDYTLRIKPNASGNDTEIEASDPTPYGQIVDGVTVGWTATDRSGRLELLGAHNATSDSSPSIWWSNYDFFVPVLKPSENLSWLKYPGVDTTVFGVVEENNRLTFKDFYQSAQNNTCGEYLTHMLTEESDSDRNMHYFMTRYGTGSNATIHYVPFGDRLEMPKVEADDASVTTNADYGAAQNGSLSLYGWSTANGAASSTAPKVPFAAGSTLQWEDPLFFFVESMFDVSGTGKIYLKGVSAGSGRNVMTVKPSSQAVDPELESTALSSLVQTPIEEDSSTHKLTISGWSDGSPAALSTLGDYLQRGDGREPAQPAWSAPSLVARYDDGGICYMDIGEVDIRPTDELTITTNTVGRVYSLYGADDADALAGEDDPYLPFLDGNGFLSWSSVFDFFSDNIFEQNSDGKVSLRGASASGEKLRVMTLHESDGDEPFLRSDSISSIVLPPLAADSETDKLTVSGWDGATPHAQKTLAEALCDGLSGNNPSSGQSIMVRESSGDVSYMALGQIAKPPVPDDHSISTNNTLQQLEIKGFEQAGEDEVPVKVGDSVVWRLPDSAMKVDCQSVTTNDAEGAVTQGKISLFGFASQQDFSIPYKDEDNLAWKDAASWVDGSSLAWKNDEGEEKFEVKGASDYAGKHAKHYFGTSSDKTAQLGWHELPNVTTNRVEGDEITISTTVDVDAEGEVKKFGLIGWNPDYSGEDPLFVVNSKGSLSYVGLPDMTNMAACVCSNKWHDLLEWIGDGELGEDHGLEFSSDYLDDYLRLDLGYIYSTTPDNLYFDNESNDGEIEASFNAPSNWADEKSINMTSDWKYQIKGFESGGGCSANLYDMLTNTTANCADKGKHQIMCRYIENSENAQPTTHWLPLDTGTLTVEGGTKWTGSFSYFDDTIHDGCVIVGRRPIRVSGTSAVNGNYRIRVTLGASPTAVIETGDGFTAPSGDTSYIPLYTLVNGRVTADYRGSFVVPAYE